MTVFALRGSVSLRKRARHVQRRPGDVAVRPSVFPTAESDAGKSPPGGRSELSLCPVISYAKKSVVGLGAAFAFCARKSFSACGAFVETGRASQQAFREKVLGRRQFFQRGAFLSRSNGHEREAR